MSSATHSKKGSKTVYDWIGIFLFPIICLCFVYFGIAAYGEGSGSGLFIAAYGLLMYCFRERDYKALEHDMGRAMEGWGETVDAAVEITDRHDALRHALSCILARHVEDEFIPTEYWDMAKEAIAKATPGSSATERDGSA